MREYTARIWQQQIGFSPMVNVATLEVMEKDLNQALNFIYAITQHNESNWTTGPHVTEHTDPARIRSVSIGDLIVMHDQGADIEPTSVWQVAQYGFERIDE